MALSEEKLRAYTLRLLKARMRLLCNHGFFGLLLMHLRFAVTEEHPTAYTCGEKITFGTNYLETLSDSEIDYVLLHEIMHIALQHCFRGAGLEPERYNIACDIVVNSNILKENGMDPQSITLRGQGENRHLTPDGREGHLFTAEEVYGMVQVNFSDQSIPLPGSQKDGENGTPTLQKKEAKKSDGSEKASPAHEDGRAKKHTSPAANQKKGGGGTITKSGAKRKRILPCATFGSSVCAMRQRRFPFRKAPAAVARCLPLPSDFWRSCATRRSTGGPY